ncbi:DUF3795 domain-containing protein [Candidatus Methanoperedens sp. BLZ2]|uniref:DUF3795 domain-containing protein n=1 Tax=Candidatus Methanoperedens sp. BLZ2 TaxID=2035255 RepID=UPI000BE23DE5|nr:MAG: DUF3795 domain-containing protein [Candidatus Methanoperedens sp.]
MVVTIGKCGIACGLCKNFNNGCSGCEIENISKHSCIIFNCAENKNIEHCLKCNDYPCNLMRGLSKAYCPVFPLTKLNLQ